MTPLAACGPVSAGEKVTWGLVLLVPTFAYLAALVVPVARARGERRYIVACCLAAAAIGIGLVLAPGGVDELGGRLVWAVAIGAMLGGIGFAFRKRRLLTYLVAPVLSGGVAGLGLIVLFLGALLFTDACLS